MRKLLILIVLSVFVWSCKRQIPNKRTFSFMPTIDSSYIGVWALVPQDTIFNLYTEYYSVYLYSKSNKIYCKKLNDTTILSSTKLDSVIINTKHEVNDKDWDLMDIKMMTATDTFTYLNDSTLYLIESWSEKTKPNKHGFILQLNNKDELLYKHFTHIMPYSKYKYKQHKINRIAIDSFTYEYFKMKKFR